MAKKNKIDWRLIATGLVCLTALEIYALSQGINGTFLGLVMVIIGGAIGISIENPLKK